MTNEVKIKLGAVLKNEREKKDITIKALSEQLKISIDNLTAIENGDPASIPSDLYFGLFTKSYSEAVGIDYARTIEAINDDIAENLATEKTESDDNGKQKKGTSDKESSEDSFSMKKIAIFFGAIIGGFIIFLVINILFFKSDEPVADVNSDSNTPVVKLSSEEEDQKLYGTYDWEKINYPAAEKLSMTLKPIRESWSTILADGDTVVYRILRVGRIYNVEADHRMLVSIGIPTAVEVMLNGQEVDLRNPESRRISRVAIDQINVGKFLTEEIPETIVKDVPIPLTNPDNSIKIDSTESDEAPSEEAQTTE